MSGLGFRQRRLLAVLADQERAVPFGYLVRACGDEAPSSYNNTSVALRGLARRGLARNVRRGWWEATA